MKREKSTGPRMDPCGTSRRCRKNDFCDFDKPRKIVHQKEKIESNEQNKETSRNEFMEKDGMPDRVKSFRELDSRQNRPRVRFGFVKPIRNGLRKEQNMI